MAAGAALPTLRALRTVDPRNVLAGVLLAVAVVSTLGVAWSTVAREPGTAVAWADLWAYNLAHAAAVALCLQRAVRTPTERWAWVGLAAGLVATIAANAWYTVVLTALPRVPYPSVADWLWLAYFPLTYVGLVLLVRADVRRFHLSMWLDGLVAALGVAALACALVYDDLIAVAGRRLVAVVVNLAYPVGDLLLLAMVVAAVGLLGLRCGARWWLLGAGLLVQAVADSAYAVMLADGTYVDGSRLDSLWPLGALLVGGGAMIAARPEDDRRSGAWWTTVLVPGIFAVSSVVLLAWSLVAPVSTWVGALAIGAVVAAGARAALTFREVSTLAETRREARTDDLTGLANRRAFQLGLAGALAGRAGGPVAVLLIDLDRFKEVNDAMGHHTGDALLRLVGGRLAGCVREGDLLARLGGDEFAIVLTDGADQARAEAVARRVCAALTAPFELPEISLHVGASTGIALCPDHSTDASALLQQADVAMYEAKAAGGGHQVYCSGTDAHSKVRLQTIEDLRVAIARGELVLHYQPKIDLRLGVATGVEALVRWQHPERGLLAPDTFLPLAEQTGLMRPLTAFVLDQAMAQVRRWRDQGRDLTVAINVSASNLMDAGLPDQVADLLERHGLPVEAIELEVTESVMMSDPARAQQVVARLDEMGIKVAVDDYGVGHSSLAYLRNLAVRQLKLDRAFVDQVSSDATCEAIVRSTIDLAHSLGLQMVAEGVEEEADAAKLIVLGCDVAQGFYYSHPVSADALEQWLTDRDERPDGPVLTVVARG